jgi:hypothetical protein
MSLAICPLCAGELQAVRSSTIVTLSCPACGWNCASARRTWSRHGLEGRLFLLVGLAAVLAIHFAHLQSVSAFAIAGLGLLVGGVYCWSAWRSLRKLPERTYEPSGSPVAAFTKLIPIRTEVETRSPGVMNVVPPRHAGWTWRAWAFVALAPAWVSAVTTQVKRGRIAGIDGVVLVLFFLAVFCKLGVQAYREWKLLQLGESTPGRVIYQRQIIDGRSTSSIVFYAFVDVANRPFVGEARDSTMKIKEGDPMMVFYCSSEPNRNVVLDGKNFTIEVP